MFRLAFLLLIPAFLFPAAVSAAIFAPTTAAELQTALTMAAISAEDDVINLQAGPPYFTSDNSNSTFTYNSSNNGSLTINGAGPGSSILDGNVTRQVLELISSGPSASFQISGLTIRNGRTGDVAGLEVQGVDGDMSLTDCDLTGNIEGGAAGGVALTASGNADLTVSGCRILDNSGGNSAGAQLSTTGNVRFEDNVVTGNSISSALGLTGGAVLISHGTTTSIEARGNEIRNNSSDNTHGISLSATAGATMILEGNTIADNQGIDGFAGGAKFQSIGDSEIVVRDNVITGNSASFANGIQVQNNGNGDVLFEGNTISGNVNASSHAGGTQIQNNGIGNITLLRNTITGNSADFANGIQVQNNDSGALTLDSNVISGNSNDQADHGGGQIQHNGNGDLRIVNNLFFDNVAGSQGGALSIFSAALTLTLVNNTISGNSTADSGGGGGGGIFINLDGATVAANLFNNILFENSAAPANAGNDLRVNASDFSVIQLFNNDFSQACFGTTPVCDLAAVTGLNQGSNLDSDPLFVNAEGGNFRLGTNSPALNAGDNSAPGLPNLDLAGNPRVFDGQVDLGAFEAQPFLTANPASLDFGFVSIGDEESQQLTLTNSGTTLLNVRDFQLSDSVNYEIDFNAGGNPCGGPNFSLDAGEGCDLAVNFGPNQEDELNATLQIESDTALPTVVEFIGSGQGGGGGGGCSLGGSAYVGSVLGFALMIPIWAVAFFFRRR